MDSDFKATNERPIDRPLHVIEAEPRHEAGSLHTLTARHLLARHLSPGDRIVAVVSVRVWGWADDDEQAAEIAWSGEIGGHAGRAALLGEDTLDTEPTFLDLLGEHLSGAATWAYAPVVYTAGGRHRLRLTRQGRGWDYTSTETMQAEDPKPEIVS